MSKWVLPSERYRIKAKVDGYGKVYYRIQVHQFGPFWEYHEEYYGKMYETPCIKKLQAELTRIHDNYLKSMRNSL